MFGWPVNGDIFFEIYENRLHNRFKIRQDDDIKLQQLCIFPH